MKDIKGIQIENYILEPERLAPTTFNLKKYTVTAKGKETYKVIAHSISIHRALAIISENNHWPNKKVQSLNEYLSDKEEIMTRMLIAFEELVISQMPIQ